MKKRIYLYPISSRDTRHGIYNPYMDDLGRSFSAYYEIANEDKPSNKSILDIIKYLRKIDYVFFNWIEKLPENRFGFIQTLLLFILVPIMKAFRIRIVWTMHNKLSHSGKHQRLTKAIFKLMLRQADVILTHSREGITFGENMIKGSSGRISYFAHPVKDRRTSGVKEIKFDLLIWGTISPYKGIGDFLEYLHKNGIEKKYSILIAGKCISEDYYNQLKKYTNQKIIIRNEFISDNDLVEMINSSRLVLFTYAKASILSSGALMDSLGYGASVVGPHVGAFADLAEDGIVRTFREYDDLENAIDAALSEQNTEKNVQGLNSFLEQNSWDKFAENINKILEIKSTSQN